MVLDSPILSLKEKQSIICNQKGIQTIVIENEIPDIDYKDIKIIHFTKEKDNGRYGFLMDVVEQYQFLLF